MARHTYGSFIELDIASIPEVAESVWNIWTGRQQVFTFTSSRSALYWIILNSKVKRIWMPAYICCDVSDVLQNIPIEMHYYHVGERLIPEASVLDSVEDGDAFLYVNYFGQPRPKAFLDILRKRSAVLRIEDDAHCLDIGESTPADWQLFSPRKLLGVPDGGIAVVHGTRSLPEPVRPEANIKARLLKCWPLLLGLEDPLRCHRQYQYYREAEACVHIDAENMSELTRGMLRRIAHRKVCRRRQENWQTLHYFLKSFGFLDGCIKFTPSAYPVFVPDPAGLSRKLAEKNIFCARHWSHIPSPRSFYKEHELAAHLLSIPCDHRMSIDDMAYIAEIFLETQ